MVYTINWTRTASEGLDRALDPNQFDIPSASLDLRKRILESVERLATAPHSGSVVDHASKKYWREVYCHPFRIYYRVFESKRIVSIALIWHASRDEPTRADLLG